MPRNRLSYLLNRVFLLSVLCGVAPSAAFARQGAGSSPCNCTDLQSLQHRLKEVTALKSSLQTKLQAANGAEIASRLRWQTLEAETKTYLQRLTYEHPATAANAALLNNPLHPSCGAPGGSFGVCLDQDWAAHQRAHEQSCQVGRWGWQNMWTVKDMLAEEINAVQAEIDFLQAAIARLACQCPHFMIVVQVVTTTEASGFLTERSRRSLNGMNGIPIPIVLHNDGTFEGFGSGSDAGTAYGQAGPDRVTSQFGNQVSIRATGKVQPGSCTTRPCKPAMMHLILSGVTSRQSQVAHATAPGVNMTIRDTTPGSAGVVEFDLPAYVGASGERTFIANSMMNSKMTVMIVPATGQAGDSSSAASASLLYSVMECRLAQVLPPGAQPGGPLGGGGGGTGGGAKTGAGAGGQVSQQNEVMIAVNESVHLSDAVLPPVSLNIAEGIKVSDSVLPPVSLTTGKTVSVQDTALPQIPITLGQPVYITNPPKTPPK